MAASISNEIAIKEIFENNSTLFFYITTHLSNNARPVFACMILLLWFNCTSLRTIQLWLGIIIRPIIVCWEVLYAPLWFSDFEIKNRERKGINSSYLCMFDSLYFFKLWVYFYRDYIISRMKILLLNVLRDLYVVAKLLYRIKNDFIILCNIRSRRFELL